MTDDRDPLRRCAALGLGEVPLLRARDEVIDQHGKAGLRPRSEPGDRRVEVVDPALGFDDDGGVAQVVAPHPLDQAGIVVALHPQAAGPGDLGRALWGGDRARRGPSQRQARRRNPVHADQRDRLAGDSKAARQVGHPTCRAIQQPQHHPVAVPFVDRSAGAGRPVHHGLGIGNPSLRRAGGDGVVAQVQDVTGNRVRRGS